MYGKPVVITEQDQMTKPLFLEARKQIKVKNPQTGEELVVSVNGDIITIVKDQKRITSIDRGLLQEMLGLLD